MIDILVTLKLGVSSSRTFTITNADGTARSLTGLTPYLLINQADDATVLTTEITGTASGSDVSFTIPALTTATIGGVPATAIPAGQYPTHLRLKVTAGGAQAVDGKWSGWTVINGGTLLTSIEAVRAYLTGSVPVPAGDEPLLESLISSVSEMFEADIGCPVLTASYTDTWNGDGGTYRLLNQYPVGTIGATAVLVDGDVIVKRPSIGEDGWVLTSADIGKLELVGYTFAVGKANCVVTYTAGLGAQAPADIDQAIVDQVAYLYKGKERVGISNESTSSGGSVTYLGGWKAQMGGDGKTPLYLATVERYRRLP